MRPLCWGGATHGDQPISGAVIAPDVDLLLLDCECTLGSTRVPPPRQARAVSAHIAPAYYGNTAADVVGFEPREHG